MNRRATGWFVLLALGLAAAGCTSRTLPLPPPSIDSVAAPNAQGLSVVTGTAHENASIGIVNDSTLEGVIVTSHETDCSSTCPFEAAIPASAGDRLRAWQFFETTSSREVEVPE
jgi:hypothetical protein